MNGPVSATKAETRKAKVVSNPAAEVDQVVRLRERFGGGEAAEAVVHCREVVGLHHLDHAQRVVNHPARARAAVSQICVQRAARLI